MRQFTKVFFVAVFWFGFLPPVHAEPPSNWAEMEVEAKWVASKNAFERMIAELSDGASNFGYTFRVRWSGIPRKFVDYYYETDTGALSADLHSLRHRTRYTSTPLAANRALSTVINATWSKDWERIQYKSTPRRIGSVWFRKEVGDCRIWDSDNAKVCPNLPTSEASTIIQDSSVTHEALTFLSQDHPQLDRQNLNPFMVVTDFRYRVVFAKNESDILEVSLDHLIAENLLTGEVSREYEAELEIIASNPTDENLAELFRVSEILEGRYKLTPSTSSKGGNEVPEYE